MPLVTVCIPTYNGAAYIGEAVSSVLAQTFTDFELLVVDDHSSDATPTIVRSFSDSRLKFVQNPTRLGLVGNWNRCLDLAQGNYICLFHQDDVMLTDNLAEKVSVLQNNPSVGFVYSDVYLIDANGTILADHWFYSTLSSSRVSIETGSDYFQKLMTGDNLIACPSVLARRECYTRVGKFDNRFPFTADLEMWLRIALFYDVAYIARPLIKYRWHPENETHNFSEIEQWEQLFNTKRAILNKYPKRLPNSPILEQSLRQQYQYQSIIRALYHIRHGNYATGKWYLNFAISISRNSRAMIQAFLHALLVLATQKIRISK